MASHKAGFFLHVARIPERFCAVSARPRFFWYIAATFFLRPQLEGPGKIRQRKSFVENSLHKFFKKLNSEMIFYHFLSLELESL